MGNFGVLRAEQELEALVRTVACSVCGAQPGRPCNYAHGRIWPILSHTGRYKQAASLDLVPPLPKWRPLSPDIAATLLASLKRPEDSLQMPESRSAHG